MRFLRNFILGAKRVAHNWSLPFGIFYSFIFSVITVLVSLNMRVILLELLISGLILQWCISLARLKLFLLYLLLWILLFLHILFLVTLLVLLLTYYIRNWNRRSRSHHLLYRQVIIFLHFASLYLRVVLFNILRIFARNETIVLIKLWIAIFMHLHLPLIVIILIINLALRKCKAFVCHKGFRLLWSYPRHKLVSKQLLLSYKLHYWKICAKNISRIILFIYIEFLSNIYIFFRYIMLRVL